MPFIIHLLKIRLKGYEYFEIERDLFNKLGVLVDGDFKFGVLLLVFVRFLGGDTGTDHGTKPGTAIQCTTKGSGCHRQSSVRVLSVIRAAQSSVFCVFFFRPLFIIFSFFDWPLH
jgi:hypothetical protein